jgi:iron complex outermembrane recepter protein
MSNVTKLSDAIKFALFVGAASSAASVSALAQDAATEATTLDRVEVTGSRIKKVDSESAQPVTVITRADIEKSGVTNVFDLLQAVTAADGSGLSNITTQTNGSDGSQFISLRGLGSQRTLVLVDGKRWVTDINGQSDLSTIPIAIIERIDILKDGASATYGSDAIAGVVNLITRKNYEGAQVGLQYGQFEPGDGSNTSADFIIGAAGERSSAVVSVSYSNQDEVFAGNRLISAVPYFGEASYYNASGRTCYDAFAGNGIAPLNSFPYNFCGSGSGQYGLFTGQSGSGISGQALLNGTNASPNLANGIDPSDYAVRANTTYLYNYAPINYLYQPSERYNIFAAGRVELTDNITAYTRLTYSKRTSSQQLAEVPLTVSNAGNNGPQWAFPLAANSIMNPWGVQSGLNGGAGWQINSVNYRMSALGPRRTNEDVNAMALQVGLEGSFELGERYFAWDVDYQYNDGSGSTNGTGYVNLFNLKNALGASGYDAGTGEYFCGTSYATRIKGCVPFFVTGGPTLGVGAVLNDNGLGGGAVGTPTRVYTAEDAQASLNYVGYELNETRGNTANIFSGNISGDLFELPAGMWSFALGFDMRDYDGFFSPDSLVSEGGSSTNFTLPTNGSQEVDEYYVELNMPLLKDIFLIQELELAYAFRQSYYNASGLADPNPGDSSTATEFVKLDEISTGNSFVSAKWKPIDSLLVRYTWGESFRAPSIGDLFGGTGEGFPQAQDRCSTANYGALTPAGQAQCDADTGLVGVGTVQPFAQIRGLFGSSVDLQPETGKNETIGLVWSPSFLEGFEVSLDYWKITLDDAISSYSVGFVINRCYNNLDPSFCALISRDVAPAGTGQINVVNTLPFNLAGYRTAGYDLSMSYNLDGGFTGNWSFNIDSTKVDYFETKSFTTSSWVDSTGTYNGTANPEYKTNFFVDWSLGDWGASWVTRTMSNIYENCFFYCNTQGENDGRNNTGFYAVHDLQVRWSAPWDATVSIGKRNLFDKEPPVLTNNTFAHSFDSAYDIPGGGYWYMSYRQDF